LGVKPRDAVAIEDSDVGAKSALDAGTRLVLVPDIKENDAKIKEQAWHVVRSLDEIIPIIQDSFV
jgi:beta-phosphoglucomutase-like phosphatase (HAD superfamily)